MPRSSSASTSLQIRPASDRDYPEIEKLVLESFEPITWARTLDEKFGPLNGLDWQARWRLRLEKIVVDQAVLVGTVEDTIAAMTTSTVDRKSALSYIELLAVAPHRQGHGYGREMLRATIRHLKELGAEYINLDCLTNNENANELYRSEGFEEVARHIRWFRKI
jgi:ribosomal protein S18 acetylase RimI-like enzyme